jgi:chemotaxis protein MotB
MSGHDKSAKGSTARARRKKGGHDGGGHEGSERWLVTYADMLTLLLVLFIVLFSISVVNTSKYISLKTSLATAFGSGQKSLLDGGTSLNNTAEDGTGQQIAMQGLPVIPNTSQTQKSITKTQDSPADYKIATQAKQEVNNYRQIEQSINSALTRNKLQGSVQFKIDERGLVITVVTNALVFPPNSATLLGEGNTILSVVSPQLAKLPNLIEVDGFTNQQAVSTYPYPSGWELSSARASAVVRYLAANGVNENRLTAVGYSDQKPLYPASDPRSVTRNRRVEIVVESGLPAGSGGALVQASKTS